MVDGTRHGVSAGREGGWYHSSPEPPRPAVVARTRHATVTLRRVTAILGGLVAAALWAAATLASSRSSRMLGSRVVLAWVMLIGCLVGIPLAAIDAPVDRLEPRTITLLAIAGICYVAGLALTYAALQIGKVSIVAPIVATEGAVAAVIAVWLGDAIGLAAGVMLAVIAIGVVLSSLDRSGTDVPAGDTDLVADALDGPPPPPSALSDTPPLAPGDARKSALLAIAAAVIFGVGLVASGTAASLVPVAWVALSARIVGVAVITASDRAERTTAPDPGRPAVAGHLGRRRDPRLDGLGVGRPREHRDRRRSRVAVRGHRGRRCVPAVRRAAQPGAGRRGRARRGRGDGAGRDPGLTTRSLESKSRRCPQVGVLGDERHD